MLIILELLPLPKGDCACAYARQVDMSSRLNKRKGEDLWETESRIEKHERGQRGLWGNYMSCSQLEGLGRICRG